MKLRNFVIASAIAISSFGIGATITSVSATAPVTYDEYNNGSKIRDWNVLPATDCLTAGGSRRLVPNGQPLSVCTPATTTTTRPPTTTAAPTTTTTTAPTTTVAVTTTTTTPTTTTTIPSGAQFVEAFDGGAGLSRFRYGVYHRNLGYYEAGGIQARWGDGNAGHGGSWTGDHDLNCGGPDTQRPFSDSLTPEVADLLYVCGPNASVGNPHLMSAMGDVDGFSIVWFSPNQVFSNVNSVSFDVNLTDLGARKWWKVGVVSDALFNSTHPAGTCVPNGSTCNGNWKDVRVPGFIISDVGSGGTWTQSLAGSDRLYATWNGGASAGYPAYMKIGDTSTGVQSNPAPNDKMTRFPVSLVDNKNGTITFTVAGTSITRAGSFPACPCRVVFLDQNYTPDKDGSIQGHTWHWDNIAVR